MTPTPQECQLRAQESSTTLDGDRIVISGMSGLYPSAHNVEELSDILYNKKNPLSASALRYDYKHPEAARYGGTVPGVQYFDAQFFKAHFRLANRMDPMSRKILEQSYQAIYDAVKTLQPPQAPMRTEFMTDTTRTNEEPALLRLRCTKFPVCYIPTHLCIHTKCGGVLINNIKFEHLPPMDDIKMSLSTNDQNETVEQQSVCMSTAVPVSNNVTLQCNQLGDYDSLSWVEAPELTEPGVTVKVHYVGINNDDCKRANGLLKHKQNTKNSFGMDFSGVTENGTRVMGLVRRGAACSVVHARPELLWPVPAHWSLEDAATVPLAYAHALYCLVIRCNWVFPKTVLVHGGAGALGQAVISVSLAMGYEVFTTVSDVRKKHFLLKLFPALKADHIGNSRDDSFGDMVLSVTKGIGCDLVISCVSGELKNTSLKCTGRVGMCIDVSQLHNYDHEFSYGMHMLTKERAYNAVDFSSIFDHKEECQAIQAMISEGIARGYVRPLSRVTYAPHDAPRAFRLLAASRHLGRVLLRMQHHVPPPQPGLTCSAEGSQLILCNDNTFGLQLADRLVERGARKLCVHFKRQSTSYLQIKKRSWKKHGVEVVELTDDPIQGADDVIIIIKHAMHLGPLEGIYVILGDNQNEKIYEDILSMLDLKSRTLCSDVKQFAVINIGDNEIGKDVCLRRIQRALPATILKLPEFKAGGSNRGAVKAVERALCVAHAQLVARALSPTNMPLIQNIAFVADLTLVKNADSKTTLQDLGATGEKITKIINYLRVQYNVMFTEEQVLTMTVDKVHQLENTFNEQILEERKGLSTFFNYVDSNELLASMELVFLPTLTTSAAMRENEFNTSESFLCIVPGMEGHYERFRVLCERLKLPALVLQPGFDHPHETLLQTAQRYAQVLLKKTGMKNHFYLLGYESGIAEALEVAAILEEQGLTGTVFCLGFMPDEFKIFVEEQLSQFMNKERMQEAVVEHIFALMAGGEASELEHILRTDCAWSHKMDACVRWLLGRVSHSANYARALVDAAVSRIERARVHVSRARPLRSQLVVLRAHSAAPLDVPAAQAHSQQPLAVYQLDTPLSHVARDLRCAAIINDNLHPDVLQQFNNSNLCDTYLLNDSFVTMKDD